MAFSRSSYVSDCQNSFVLGRSFDLGDILITSSIILRILWIIQNDEKRKDGEYGKHTHDPRKNDGRHNGIVLLNHIVISLVILFLFTFAGCFAVVACRYDYSKVTAAVPFF